MDAALRFNGIAIDWNTTEIGDTIIRLAKGHLHDEDLAAWLRTQT